ncbi:unnamed protein product [Protopolystoma xenopodis]|uniref:Uncharacterized protein n=1 Tax=Protopolystoma xenopodis TaxID=117903 RepID=A0A3S4ZAU6_9PLAT|nr:unnamed protein product [Protopolystoma xenopodis]
MTGLIEHKEYDWKDSNLALFGSDEDKKVKSKSTICYASFYRTLVPFISGFQAARSGQTKTSREGTRGS